MDAVEDSLGTEVRKLKLENEEMAQELRDVKRRLRDVSNKRSTAMTGTRHEREADGPAPREVTSSTSRGENAPNYEVRSNAKQHGARQRAATFSGQAHKGGARPKVRQHGGNDMQQSSGCDQQPKPQRVGERRTRAQQCRQGGGDRDSNSRDNPIRTWLASKKDGNPVDSTPVAKQCSSVVMRSPSWVDDESEDDDDISTSAASTPTPAVNLVQACDDDSPTQHPASPDDIAISRNGVDDVYLLPPSGQVSEPNNRYRRKGDADGATGAGQPGGRAKSRGKSGPNIPNAQRGAKTEKPSVSKSTGSKGGKGASYAKMVTKNGWTTVQKKRKFESVSPKVGFPLRGIPTTVNRNVYLQGLDMSEGQCAEDMADSIRAYLRERGVIAIFIRIIPVRNDSTRTGCKLTIKEEDFERVIQDDFWPDDVTVREWTPRVRNDEGEDNL